MAQPIAWIKANFQRGTQAGSFLHKLFEYIDFQASRDSIAEEVKRRFHNDKEFNSDVLLADLIAKLDTAKGSATVQEADIFAHMTEWLKDVLNTPLHDTFQLSALSTAHYLSEFPFYLALADQRLFIQAIQQLFEDAGRPIQDLNEAATARYRQAQSTWFILMDSVITLPTIRVIIWVPISTITKKPILNIT